MKNEKLKIKNQRNEIPIVIIAAGRGKRFGGYPKILSDLNGKPIIHYVLNAALKSKAGNIFLVLGYNYKLINSALNIQNLTFRNNSLTREPVNSLTILHNRNWYKGKSSSIKTAIKNISETSKGVLFLLGDMPYITSKMIKKAEKEFIKNNCRKIVYFGNKNNIGHPVIFPKKYFNELLKLKGEAGGKAIVRNNIKNAISVGKFSKAIQKDIDIPQNTN